jgi:HK97 family phage major capsid protein
MSTLIEIKEVIDHVAKDLGLFQKNISGKLEELSAQQAAQLDRIEELESRKGGPGRNPRPGDKKAMPEGVKVLHSSAGEQIVIDHKTRLQDVLPKKKESVISLERCLAAQVAGDRCQDKEALEYYRDQKQLSSTSTGILIFDEHQNEWHDNIRQQSQLIAAGMRTTVMLGKTQSHTAVASDPATSWHNEGGSINVGNPTFEPRQLTARTLTARCQASVEVSQDSADFGSQLMQVMTRAIAQEIDRVGLIGTGTGPEPQGLHGHPSVTHSPVNSPSADAGYFAMINAIETLLEAGISLEEATASVIMSPGAWRLMESEPTGLSGDNSQLPRPRSLQNTVFRIVPSIANTSSPSGDPMFFGRFSDLLLGVRREASVEVLKSQSYATNLLLEFIAYARVDYLVTRPASFVVHEEFQTTG